MDNQLLKDIFQYKLFFYNDLLNLDNDGDVECMKMWIENIRTSKNYMILKRCESFYIEKRPLNALNHLCLIGWVSKNEILMDEQKIITLSFNEKFLEDYKWNIEINNKDDEEIFPSDIIISNQNLLNKKQEEPKFSLLLFIDLKSNLTNHHCFINS